MSLSRVSPYLPSFVGGTLCLDFVNTVDPRHADERDDFLGSYQDLVHWSDRAGLLSRSEALELEQRSQAHPTAADAVHSRALELREALYRLFAPDPAEGAEHARRGDINRLNDESHRAWTMAELAATDAGWVWQWRPGPELDRVLWPIARSACDLLTSDLISRIRECEGSNGCGWLFVDTSRNGRRRWCDMRVCGNRAKARRHRERIGANTSNALPTTG
jgi:predicted RNA-binding Zn ribbon-like protein